MIARAAFRSALRATKAPISPLAQIGARRGYAEAVSDKLKLSFILPHEVRISIPFQARLLAILAQSTTVE